MTMFKPRPSQSPVRQIKRHNETPLHSSKMAKIDDHQDVGGPKFTFDQVKIMLETMLEETERNKRTLVSHGLKGFDFNNIAGEGHSAEHCRELIGRLVKSTRRTRTLNEVLSEIRDNLDRKTYTEIIQRATMNHDNLPRRPPSAYLLYHQDRYHELKHEYPLAAAVSKIVSEEWKHISDRKRREYQKKHNDLVRSYENELRNLGLLDDVEPKRPKSASSLYVQDRMDSLSVDEMSKQELNELKKELVAEFESLDKDDKTYWNDLAKEKMEQYRREQEEFAASHPHLKPKAPRKVPATNGDSRPAKPDLPIPPRTPLKIYLDKKMPDDVSGEEADDLRKQLKEKFSQLSQKKLLKFIKKAIKDKDRYERDVEQFVEEHPSHAEQFSDVKTKIKPNLSKEQSKLYQSVVENRPSLPVPTCYLYYCGKLLSNDTYSKGNDPTVRMQKASEDWRELSDRERSKWETEHAETIKNYIADMTKWLEEVNPERKRQILAEEPRANPEYWRKRVKRSKRSRRT